MEKVTGYWYNGISSKPGEVNLKIDVAERKLLLESDGKAEHWFFIDLNVQITGGAIHIYNNTLPAQSIFTEHLPFGKLLEELSGSGKSWYYRLVHAGLPFHILLALFIIGLISGAYFFVVPLIAEKSVDIIPEDYDKAMGENFFQNYIEYEDADSSLSVAVQDFVNEMNIQTAQALKVTVVESSEKNAFALPSGHIVVYTGILESMDEYPELAALLSHEAAHVQNRHSMKMLARNLAGYLLISAVLSDVNGIMAVFADNANQLGMLSYSRSFEEEADEDGWVTLKENGIDPEGMVNLFNHLKSDDKFVIPAFLSTHPLTDERIKSIKSIIRKNPFIIKKNQKLADIFKVIEESLGDKKK